MFKLGETYYTKGGYEARILCVDASYKNGTKPCPVVALITVPINVAAAGQVVYFYSEDGKLIGTGNVIYNIMSNEPNEEETSLISQMLDLAEGGVPRREEALLKIIRQIRKK
jgi:hypothetical protein